MALLTRVADRVVLLGLLVGCTSTAAAPVPGSPAAPAATAPVPVVVAPAAVPPAAIPPARDDGRLPPDVRPTRYALDLVIDPSRASFSGRVWIGVTIDRSTRAIVLHGRGLTVRQAVVVQAARRIPVQAAARPSAGSGQDAEELTLLSGEPLSAGEAELDISYEAPFSPGLKGLYRVEQRGDAYAYTQFEPTDARRAFPCFDEPGYKTPFDIAITAPKGAIAVSNGPESARRDTDDGKGVRFEFQRSPPLPSYLVAFAVGPFDILERPKSAVPIRMVATKGQAALGAAALDVAAAHLDLLGKYFDRPYPYAKLDIVAVPNFGSGAMENAGLVTFREELLLLDPAHASTNARRTSASVIAHELSHQWFGDLVTMKWWDDLWLNEAFASWMADKLVDEWRPETRARLGNLTGKWQVMAEDALSTARKIRNPVRSTSQALEAFDAITYGKGRSVLAMTEAWLGDDVFRDGLRRYIKKHEWGNATAADLYAALAEASGGKPVAAVMDSFTDQTGVPLVTATAACPSPDVRLGQRQYRTVDQVVQPGVPSPPKMWRVPVCVAGAVGAAPRCTVLESAEGQLAANAVTTGGASACSPFVYPNAGESGYFRVGLTAADLRRLGPAALATLPERERAGVVNNAWAAVWSGELHVADLLSFIRGFRAEKSRLVWVQITDALIGIDRGLIADSARPAFARLTRELLTPVARRLGWSPPASGATGGAPESDDDKLLRELALATLGGLGDDPRVLSEARRRATAWLDRADAVPADAVRVALPLAARKGDSKLFERLLAAVKNASTPERRLLALAGLTGFEDPALVRRTLDLTLDGTLRAQDLRYVFQPFTQRRATRDTTFAWIEAHFDALVPQMPNSLRGRFIRLAGTLCDTERVRALQTFLQPRVDRLEGTAKDMRQAVEEGLRCATVAGREREPTSAWLARPSR